MGKFYLEGSIPQRDQKAAEKELRSQVAAMLPSSSFRGKLDPATAPIAVLETLAGPIHREFQETASRTGQLVVEEYTDAQGRQCKRYHGSSRAGLAPFSEGGVRVKLAEVSHFDGRVFLAGREPRDVRAAMLLRKNGLE